MHRVFLYWNLQMSRKLKTGLFALTGGGLIVGAAAVMKTIYIRVIQVTDDVTCTANQHPVSLKATDTI